MITASLLDGKTLHLIDVGCKYAVLVVGALVVFYLLTQPPNPPRSA